MKKKIIFKLSRFPVPSETFITNQIVIAIKCGFEVKILINELFDINSCGYQKLIVDYNLEDKIIIKDYKEPKKKFNKYCKALYLILINIFSSKNLLKYLIKEKEIVSSIFKFAFYKSLNNYDLIHVQYGTNIKPLDLLKEIGFLKPALVVSFHGHDLYFPINGRIPKAGYYDSIFKTDTSLIANTPYLEKLLIDLGAKKNNVKVIPVAVDTTFFHANNRINKGKIKLISVGRLEIFKGHAFGIECAKILKNKGIDFKYYIIGEGSQMSKLKELIQVYELSDFVELLGRRTQTEVQSFLTQSDIFLMTSITDPNYGVESQGLVTAEAQACGLPVLAFDSGGVKYTIDNEKTGFLVTEKDVETLANKAGMLIENDILRKRMGEKARNFIEENFSQNHILGKWETIYKTASKL